MIDPKRIAKQVALRCAEMQGTSASGVELSYQMGYLAMDGNRLSPSTVRDAVLAVECELAEVIANDKANPYRSLLYGRSGDLPSGSMIPTAEAGGSGSSESGSSEDEPALFIGVFSDINDSVDDTPLTEQTIQSVRRFLRGSYQTKIYHYTMMPGRIIHTRPNVYFEGCVFSRPEAQSRFNTTSQELSPLPTSLESTWVARTIEFLAKEGWLGNEAGFYAKFAESGIARLRARSLDLPVLPSAESTPRPGVN